jgi:hypothetical protein
MGGRRPARARAHRAGTARRERDSGAVEWRRFLDRLLLGLAAVLAGAGVIFFVAANWQELGRFAKFALVELPIVLALAACWRFDLSTRTGQAALVAAALCTGALLALVGQVYQTGADTWELFAAWAVAIAGWVAVARMPRFGSFGSLVNVAIALYFTTFGGIFGIVFGTREMLWTLFAATRRSSRGRRSRPSASNAARALGGARYRDGLRCGGRGSPCGRCSTQSRRRVGNRCVRPVARRRLVGVSPAHRRSVHPRGAVLSAIVVITATLARHLLERGPRALSADRPRRRRDGGGGRLWLRQVAAEEQHEHGRASDAVGPAAYRRPRRGRLSAAEDAPAPWYVRTMLGVAGWIAAAFLLGFVGIALGFVTADPRR